MRRATRRGDIAAIEPLVRTAATAVSLDLESGPLPATVEAALQPRSHALKTALFLRARKPSLRLTSRK